MQPALQSGGYALRRKPIFGLKQVERDAGVAA
jgi:hypothetical protein